MICSLIYIYYNWLRLKDGDNLELPNYTWFHGSASNKASFPKILHIPSNSSHFAVKMYSLIVSTKVFRFNLFQQTNKKSRNISSVQGIKMMKLVHGAMKNLVGNHGAHNCTVLDLPYKIEITLYTTIFTNPSKSKIF